MNFGMAMTMTKKTNTGLLKYCKAQVELAKAYTDKKGWAKKTLINIANAGKFSSDRTIEDYVRDIWHLKKVEVDMTDGK